MKIIIQGPDLNQQANGE